MKTQNTMTDTAAKKCNNDCPDMLISKTEYAALVAVSEAARNHCETFFGKPTSSEKSMLKSLAKLAAVRNQKS